MNRLKNFGRAIPLMFALVLLSSCAATNPNSEIMVDTSSKTKQTVVGESPRTVQPSQLGDPSAIGPAQ